MFCTKCGAKNEDNAKFCYSCGNNLNAAEVEKDAVPDSNVAQGNNESTYWENPSLSNPVQQTSGLVQQIPNPGQPIPPQFNYQPGVDGTGIQKAKKKPLIIAVPIIAVIVVIGLISFIVSRSNKGILDNIIGAVQGTLKADSFEFEAEAYTTDEEYGKDGGKIDGIIEYDLDKEKLSFDIGMGEDRTILYDEVAYDVDSEGIWNDQDISYELGMIFDYYKDYKDDLNNLSDIDWEAIADEAGIPIDFDVKELQKCIKEFEKNMNSTKYMKTVCNKYEKKNTSEGTKYSFDVDVPKFVESLVETFKPVIEDYVDESEFDYIYDQLDIVEECIIEITVKGGKLVGINANITVNDYSRQTLELQLTIDNYGKASLNVDEIEGYIEDYDSYND